jgi:hypothetical protein
MMTLDEIEHDTLRARGRYDDPRIHFAVNCASVGCPMLREEAFVAERLDTQLDEQAARFMADRSRNRYAAGKLEVSRIFDWYGKDFALGHKGVASLQDFMARHADLLADKPRRSRTHSRQRPPAAELPGVRLEAQRRALTVAAGCPGGCTCRGEQRHRQRGGQGDRAAHRGPTDQKHAAAVRTRLSSPAQPHCSRKRTCAEAHTQPNRRAISSPQRQRQAGQPGGS